MGAGLSGQSKILSNIDFSESDPNESKIDAGFMESGSEEGESNLDA
jgi:hypothetical protein